jgi:lipopolysaccharide/colanic/teichoic acid biosynthesis glycosyltransferase
LNRERHRSVNDMVKRLLDVVAASVGLMVSGPLMIIVAIMIRGTMGSPVLFRQRRPGLHGRIFTVLKFRTMSVDREREGQSQFDSHRVTPLGRILRQTSLDELPQLFNVLRGDMSLVGPRPLLPEYLPYYSNRELLRHTVRPGITGWAQVNGRNRLSWDQRLALDVWYAEHRSMLLDLRILYLTAIRVLQRRDVNLDPRVSLLPLDRERSHSSTIPR